jgi:hypothetical protein
MNRESAALCGLLGVFAMITHGDSAFAGQHRAHGHGTTPDGGTFFFTVAGGEEPGVPAAGIANFTAPPSTSYPEGFKISGHVTCVLWNVPHPVTREPVPGTARFSFTIEDASPSLYRGLGFVVWVSREGRGVLGTGFVAAPTANDCSIVPQVGSTPAVDGRITVE